MRRSYDASLAAVIRKPRTWIILAAAALFGLWLISRANPEVVRGTSPPVDEVAAPAPSLTNHVILISIDGLRPDAIDRYRANTLRRLAREGRFARDARTVIPSRTLPSHASMLTGLPPAEHGLQWNEDSTASRGYIDVPTIFTRARAHGLVTAAFYAKTKFEHLSGPGGLDFVQRPRGGWMGIWAEDVKKDVAHYLEDSSPNLLFIHLADPDFLGHAFGWMTPLYGHGVREADDAVSEIVTAANDAFGSDGYTLIVTADHGGRGLEHGIGREEDVRIPWIAWGRGVRGSGAVSEPVTQMRTAATVLWLLGVPPSDSVRAAPVTEAFVTPSNPRRPGSAPR